MFSDRVPLYIPKMIISYHIPLSHIHLYHTIRIPMIYVCIPNCFPTSHPYDPCRGWSSPGSASMVRLLVRRWRRAVCRASTSARRAQETRGIRMGSELGDGRMDHSGFIKFYKPKWSIWMHMRSPSTLWLCQNSYWTWPFSSLIYPWKMVIFQFVM